MKVDLILKKKPRRIGGVQLHPGDAFQASRTHARALVALKIAEYPRATIEPVKEPIEEPIKEPESLPVATAPTRRRRQTASTEGEAPARRAYRRRDMSAE